MNTGEKFGLIITYIDGSHDHFQFPPQLDKENMAQVIEKLMSLSVLSLQLEDRLVVIPTCGIRSAEIFPLPAKLPDIVLRKVQRVPRIS